MARFVRIPGPGVLRQILVGCLVAVLLTFLLSVYGLISQLTTSHRLAKTSTEALLAACRQMIRDEALYRNDAEESDAYTFGKNHPVVLDSSVAPLGDNVPLVIRQLHPQYVLIFKDKVLVRIGVFPREYLLGFREGAKEYGSERLTNGLWTWTGRVPPDSTVPLSGCDGALSTSDNSTP